ncbi:hypothetical protein [Capnocytophaga canimorsus]|uniref:hypothetical protein n=1 Tax=Capnocytophaga canimorsus TaxID=28188 RepID=UPI000BB19ED8|nr:hypothetical protein [Capnocytophaga canimorsus]ATA76481.1 hypothetical protein CGC47_02155 [Capnocytophaga canimorsus]PJI75997.1 hypothetical protein CLV61_2095 [Capnocytophaga canimorsus]STA71630.1 Uncharacterised protein [Capnocytophaga canimorsus]
MDLTRKELKKIFLENEITKKYSINLIEDYIKFYLENEHFNLKFYFRLQFDSLLTLQTFTISLKKLESEFKHLVIDDLRGYYNNYIDLNPRKFYPTDHSFSKDIQSKEELDEFLSDFYLCLNFYETEIFPKLTDIHFLADYVGSVPFEQRSEIVVGGSFPLQLFKKIAILKWGNHPRYEEYKDETQKLIELYAIKKPEKTEEVRLFQKGFEKLIYHLENEPNPFL